MELQFNIVDKEGRIKQSVVLQCPYLVIDGQEKIKLIELVGPATAVKAAFADIVRRRTGNYREATGLMFQHEGSLKSLYVMPGDRYFQAYSTKGRMIVMHSGFHTDGRYMMLGGNLTEPSPWFLDAFQKTFTTIPVLPEWMGWLWIAGIDLKLIVPLSNHGSQLMCWQLEKPNDKYGGNYDKQWETLMETRPWLA